MNTLLPLSDNINYLLHKTGINAAKLARDLDLPAATIKNLRCGDNKNPTLSTLIPIAQYFSITVSQLIGEVAILDNENTIENQSHSIVKIPIVAWESVDVWKNSEMVSSFITVVEDEKFPVNFALIVVEDDLQIFSKDSVLLINAEQKPAHKDFVIVQKCGQKAVLRQFFDEGDGVFVKSLVKESPFIPLSNEHIMLGVVYSFQKKFK